MKQPIIENLEYLKETKEAIKEAIINKGVSVQDTDTFRSYAEKIDSIEPNNIEDLIVANPKVSAQSINPSSGYVGIKQVIINGVTSDIDENIKPENIKQGVTILDVTGNLNPKKIQGKVIVTPSTSQQNITPSDGYDGMSEVEVLAVDSNIDEDIKPENIKSGVNILGVDGTLEYNKLQEEITVSPMTVDQIIYPDDDYDAVKKIKVDKVTSEIDDSITPENIREGVEILGVIGNMTSVSEDDYFEKDASKLEETAGQVPLYGRLLKTVPKLDVIPKSRMHCLCYFMELIESVDISGLDDVTGVNMSNTFQYCHNLKEIIGLDLIKSAYSISSCFSECGLETLDISHINYTSTSSYEINNCPNLTTLKLPSSTHKPTQPINLNNNPKLTSIDFGGLDLSNCRSIPNVQGCTSLQNLDLSNFTLSKTKTVSFGVNSCSNLSSLNFPNFEDVSLSLGFAFYKCNSLSNDNMQLSNFSQAKTITNLQETFSNNSSIETIDTKPITISKGAYITLAKNCENLTYLDISNYKTDNSTSVYCFNDVATKCPKLKTVILPEKLSFSNSGSLSPIVSSCDSLESINIPVLDGKTVGSAIGSCSNLKSITFAGFTEKVTSIGGLLNRLDNLESITFNEQCSGCKNSLTQLWVDIADDVNDNPNNVLESIDYTNFGELTAVTNIQLASSCYKLKNIIIPKVVNNTITNINSFITGSLIEEMEFPNTWFKRNTNISMMSIFSDSKNLRRVVFGDDFNGIKQFNSAFRNCTSLELVDMRYVTSMNVYATKNDFLNVPSSCIVVVGNNTVKARFNNAGITVYTKDEYESLE